MKSRVQQLHDPFVIDGTWPSGTGFVIEPHESLRPESSPPFADGLSRHAHHLSHGAVIEILGAQQYDFRSLHQTRRKRARSLKRLELRTDTVRQNQRLHGSPTRHNSLRSASSPKSMFANREVNSSQRPR